MFSDMRGFRNTNISDIIITGDFNFNMAQNALNKMSELILEYNLTQLISEPTHVTEHSSSILDLICFYAYSLI